MKKLLWLAAGLYCLTMADAQQVKPSSERLGKTDSDAAGAANQSKSHPGHGSISIGYSAMFPVGDMKAGWSSAHGIGADMMFGLKKAPAISLGLDASMGMYAYNERTEDYLIFNGILASSEVSFSSYVGSVGFKTKFESPKPSPVKPYAAIHSGVFFISSDLSLGDWWSSNSDYYCDDYHSNTKTLVDDADWYAAINGGIKFDLSPRNKPGKNFLDLSAGYMGGGEVKYANMNRISEVPAGLESSKDVIKIVFINGITGEKQEMQLAEVYRHPISLIQAQLKFTLGL